MQKEATYKVLDYAPFGFLMPARSFTGTSGYKFGFNGMLKDGKDWTGNNDSHLDFGARIYDSRLGRWLSLDPLMAKYPSLSPYNFTLNNPILYKDFNGEDIEIKTKEGQKQMQKILIKTFGELGSNFSFNEKNKLVFNGNIEDFSKKEKEVFNGINKLIKSEDITEIIFEKNSFTDEHGGEATMNMYENSSLSKNTIYVDPAENVTKKIGENYLTEYKAKNGGTTTNPFQAVVDEYGNLKTTGNKVKSDILVSDSKAARTYHGIGHVLFPKKNEQEDVINYENKARSVFKKKKKNGKFTKSPEIKRNIDKTHKNK